MSYTLAMDLGDLIVFGGVILSIVGSAVASARKKKAQAAMLDPAPTSAAPKRAGLPVAPTPPGTHESTGLPRSRQRPAPPLRATPRPLRAALDAEPTDVHSFGRGRRAAKRSFNLKQAVIAKTILGSPRGLEGWPD